MSEPERTFTTPSIDKRRYRRVNLITQVRCEALGRQDVLRTRDVSAGGMFVATQAPYPPESLVTLSFRLKPGEPMITSAGKVVYAIGGVGMGIEFSDMREESRQALQLFVDAAP